MDQTLVAVLGTIAVGIRTAIAKATGLSAKNTAIVGATGSGLLAVIVV